MSFSSKRHRFIIRKRERLSSSTIKRQAIFYNAKKLFFSFIIFICLSFHHEIKEVILKITTAPSAPPHSFSILLPKNKSNWCQNEMRCIQNDSDMRNIINNCLYKYLTAYTPTHTTASNFIVNSFQNVSLF